jgi:hypothetical protein
MLEIVTLVSSANKTGSDTKFNLRGREFICIMNNKSNQITATYSN